MTTANRVPSNLRQQLGLVAFGLFLAVLALETALRLGGFIILSLQEHRNAVAMRQKGAYRILCIGESTTQRQYPPFLEQAINGRNLGIRFSVIDRGISGATTSLLMNRLESGLKAYHPDMVVAMMGINDRGPHMPFEPKTKSKTVRLIWTLKTYKLARISWMHIAGAGNRVKPARHDAVAAEKPAIKPKAQSAFAQDQTDQIVNPKKDAAFRELGRTYREQGRFADAEAALKKALAIDPSDDGVYSDLGDIYDLRRQRAMAVAAYKNALKINPRNVPAYTALGWIYYSQADFAEAAEAYKKALEINPRSRGDYGPMAWAIVGLSDTHSESQKQLARSLLQELTGQAIKAGLKLPDRVYGAISTAYMELGEPGLARQYQDKAEESSLKGYNPVTADNFRRLHEILDRRGIKLVCVQYPMRRLDPLRNIFQGKTNGIVFVDNEKIFRDAVQKSSFREYFKDTFGGDFGHCTDKGNELLARNIADVLAREVFGK